MAQYAPADSLERNRQTGERLIKQGRDCFIAGGITTAAGCAIGVTPLIIGHFSEPVPEGEFREDMLSPIMFAAGLGCVVVGVGTMLYGIPVTVAGNGILNSDQYWKYQRYNNPGQRGFGLILDASTLMYWVQLKATAGYHFNKNFFLGGGIGGSLDFNGYNDRWGYYWPGLPVYAEMRYSMLNRFFSPYIGLSAGYDIIDGGPYMGADLGLRIRMSPTSPKSFWVAATAEVSGYFHAGVKMGWSF